MSITSRLKAQFMHFASAVANAARAVFGFSPQTLERLGDALAEDFFINHGGYVPRSRPAGDRAHKRWKRRRSSGLTMRKHGTSKAFRKRRAMGWR